MSLMLMYGRVCQVSLKSPAKEKRRTSILFKEEVRRWMGHSTTEKNRAGPNQGVPSGISRAIFVPLSMMFWKIWLMFVVGCDADWQVLPDPLWV